MKKKFIYFLIGALLTGLALVVFQISQASPAIPNPGHGTSQIEGDANLNMNSNKITNLTDPTSNQDAATKKYVDDALPTLACANHSALAYNASCTTICTVYLGMQCVVAFANTGAHISCETAVGPSYYGGHCYCCGLVY